MIEKDRFMNDVGVYFLILFSLVSNAVSRAPQCVMISGLMWREENVETLANYVH